METNVTEGLKPQKEDEKEDRESISDWRNKDTMQKGTGKRPRSDQDTKHLPNKEKKMTGWMQTLRNTKKGQDSDWRYEDTMQH